jgi:hypothetical protein
MEYKKLVGIMIPTRKRINLLQECLDSFNQKTKEKSLVELLIKIDTDDEETIKFIEEYTPTSELDIKVVISDRKNGYGSLHEHYNSLAKVSEAEFLFGMNDDIEILTDSWEQQFKKYRNKSFILGVNIEKIKDGVRSPMWGFGDGYNAHPSIPNDIFKFIGSLQEHPMLDDWWVHITRPIRQMGLEMEKWLDITLLFKRPDGYNTEREADETYLESRIHINWNHHNSPELFEYTNKVIEYINNHPERFIEDEVSH